MNERMIELAEQADLWNGMEPTRREGRYVGYMNVSDVEKFAELIVRDVVATVKRTQPSSPDFEWAILNIYDLEFKE